MLGASRWRWPSGEPCRSRGRLEQRAAGDKARPSCQPLDRADEVQWLRGRSSNCSSSSNRPSRASAHYLDPTPLNRCRRHPAAIVVVASALVASNTGPRAAASCLGPVRQCPEDDAVPTISRRGVKGAITRVLARSPTPCGFPEGILSNGLYWGREYYVPKLRLAGDHPVAAGIVPTTTSTRRCSTRLSHMAQAVRRRGRDPAQVLQRYPNSMLPAPRRAPAAMQSAASAEAVEALQARRFA